MGSMRGWELEQRLLGDHSVYPGHPLVIALLVSHLYEDLSSAMEPTEFGWPAAVGSNDVPGGGGEVRAGLDVLVSIATGERTVDEAIQWGDARWQESKAGGHVNKVVPGQEQADRIKPLLRDRLETWPLNHVPSGRSNTIRTFS